MKKYILSLALIAATAIALSSCEPTAVYVRTRPEPPRIIHPVSPGPNYVWIDGEWIWRNGHYEYREGYWVPARSHRIWISGHWVEGRGGWYWISGHWK